MAAPLLLACAYMYMSDDRHEDFSSLKAVEHIMMTFLKVAGIPTLGP